MGNCIEREKVEIKQEEQEQNQEVKGQIEEEKKESGMRIKIVLSKEELEWLLFELKEKEGKRLEDMLEEIERVRQKEREKIVGWKPSLESIMEIPEVLDHMDRS